MRPRPQFQNPNEAGFLGLFDGKRKATIIAAEAKAKAKAEEERRASMMLQAELAKQGYDPAAADAAAKKQAAADAVALENSKQQGDTNLYYVIGGIVVAVMVGLYFIKRK